MESKKLWFKAKRYGWGWYPCSWQGWAILAMYLFVVISDVIFIDRHSHSVSGSLMNFFPHVYILTVFLIIICSATGEKAGWRWPARAERGSNKEEMYDVLDEKGNPTGRVAPRSEVHAKGLWHRTVHVWVVNDTSQILLQKRSPKKVQCPNVWASHGGHIAHGEDWRSAITRELCEELDCKIHPADAVFLGTVCHQQSFKSNTFIENEYVDIALVRIDQDISKLSFNDGEATAVQWFSLDMLVTSKSPDSSEMIIHPDELVLLQKWFANKNTK